MPKNIKKNLMVLIISLTATLMLMLISCSKRAVPSIDTGGVVPAAEMPGFTPDTGYCVVNSAWLPGFWQRWHADLFAKGVVKWDGRFDCNKFAASYCAAAQMEFYRDKFQSWTPAQALAVGEVWYLVGGQIGKGHAIVRALTERGWLFIEPQTGEEVGLTDQEIASIYFQRF